MLRMLDFEWNDNLNIHAGSNGPMELLHSKKIRTGIRQEVAQGHLGDLLLLLLLSYWKNMNGKKA